MTKDEKKTNGTCRPQDDVPEEVWLKHLLKAYRESEKELDKLRAYARGLEEENVMLQKQMAEVVERGPEVFAENKRLRAMLKAQSLVPSQLRHSKPIRTKYKMLMRYVERLQQLLRDNGISYEDIKFPQSHPLTDVNLEELEEQMLAEWEAAILRENKKPLSQP